MSRTALRLGDIRFPDGGIRPGMAVQIWMCGPDQVCGEAVDPDDGVPRRRLGIAAGADETGQMVPFEVYAKPACAS